MAARFAARAVLPKWRAANASAFVPPVCNKLLHKGSLSIMGVGGPNSRTDFHIERGAEFFWQHDGELQLPIIERGRRRLVRVGAGEIFLLPPDIPHSPQRSADSFGIVVERERGPGAATARAPAPRAPLTARAATGGLPSVPTLPPRNCCALGR